MLRKLISEVTQSCLTLPDPMDCSLPGSSIHGIFQARVLECGAIAFSESHGNRSYKTLLTLAASVFNLTPNFYSLATVMAFFQFLRDLKLMQGLNICFPFLEDSSSAFYLLNTCSSFLFSPRHCYLRYPLGYIKGL